ncbi:hypothetical protein ECHHL_1020 [Ehrlichia chaffeensis str. Heartland]|nr:hypothetical protein [Ehrlichia chaffeensis]AHX04144.1 hypothetical protein ECHHL_1020 [Ehrlichia chaffeensis str. Heartland]AHX06079.1 hypothetical protein ECHJAX_1040 [Ehrlichia chaffeensis str. Jax]AHX07264.1 hypothetical protein ECHOSC_1035 [Ehrlichia chaffeensis str. Osceola]AHX08407.1 hypothetical protein ECHSTV_1022 [Ehrlichia chaffeensis str. Saint Vincent]AHX09048.1 hypothetical protein ECHWAK_1033 [Ehrlichia chaffeensis str. Wakulla]
MDLSTSPETHAHPIHMIASAAASVSLLLNKTIKNNTFQIKKPSFIKINI